MFWTLFFTIYPDIEYTMHKGINIGIVIAAIIVIMMIRSVI